MLNKTKEPLLKKANVTRKEFCVPKQGNFNTTDKNVLELVLAFVDPSRGMSITLTLTLTKHKNILPSLRDQYQHRHCKS